MSKKRDPVIPVIQYFEQAELPLVVQTLAIAQAIVRSRMPKAPAKRVRSTEKREHTTVSEIEKTN